MFILMSIKTDLTAKEQSGKKNAFEIGGAGSIKVILILLTKVLTFYMRLFIVEIRKLYFELSFSMTFWTASLNLNKKVYIELCYLLEMFYDILCESENRH